MTTYVKCPKDCEDRDKYRGHLRANPIVLNGGHVQCVARIGSQCKIREINKLSSTEIAWILQDPEALESIINHGLTKPLKKDAAVRK